MSLKTYRTEDGITNYPLHVHKNFEIMIYVEGKGYMRTEHGDIPFQPGTIIIVPPNIKHGSRSENQFKNISIEGDFSGYFDFAEGASFDSSREKKCDVLKYALDKVGADPETSVLIGDTVFDIEGARICGTDSIGVTFGYGKEDALRAEGATYIAKNVDEIRKILLG